ncbi:MAG: CDP-glucose 4,6-dehydratase [Cellulosilyticaceae bacterium]
MAHFENSYQGKTVLVTGHTGFKGSWLCIWLNQLGANVIGYGLDPYSVQDNFVVTRLGEKMTDIRGDIRDKQKLEEVFEQYKPEIVFHLAAQALVRVSYGQPVYTYETNVMGTVNVLECIRNTPETKVGIMITTDKCYENKEQIWGYKEEDALGGYDPYSSSKAAAEIAIAAWRRSYMNPDHYAKHGKCIASVRAGNVIGGGDWAKDRIIPDCIRALQSNKPIEIRNPKAVRPWEHVLEPLSGYLKLGQKILEDPVKYSGSWNFGPNRESVVSVWEVAKRVVAAYGKGEVRDLSGGDGLHEASLLNLDISKAFFELEWRPTWGIDEAIKHTVAWYCYPAGADYYQLCLDQIKIFGKD